MDARQAPIGLRVVKEDGPASTGRPRCAHLLRIVDGLVLLLVGAIVCDLGKKQRLGDKIANTLVCADRPQRRRHEARVLVGPRRWPAARGAGSALRKSVLSDKPDGGASSAFKTNTRKIFLRAAWRTISDQSS